MDALWSMLHWWAVLGLVAVLALELGACRGPLDRAAVVRLSRIDAIYGVLAVAVVIAGFGRAWLGAKGWSFYGGNPVFWVKIGLFVLIGLLSIRPTVALVRWRRTLRDGEVVDAGQVAAIRRWIHAELALLLPIPIVAALMARGIGHG